MSVMPQMPAKMSRSVHLTDRQVEAFAQELNQLRDQILAKVGAEDANYIRSVQRKGT